MKDQAIQYLAMDVHQATIVACVRDERGAITMRDTIPTEARTILTPSNCPRCCVSERSGPSITVRRAC